MNDVSHNVPKRLVWQAPTLQAIDLMGTLGGPELGAEDVHGHLLGT